jgi:hypothetical protein
MKTMSECSPDDGNDVELYEVLDGVKFNARKWPAK